MPNRRKGKSARVRRQRSSANAVAEVRAESSPAPPRKRKARGAAGSDSLPPEGSRATANAQTHDGDGRPPPPWHPVPLSEILILAGAVAFVIGMIRSSHGFAAGAPTLLSGLVIVGLATMEFTWREHSSGYRSHTLLLALLPVIALHSVVILGVSAFAKASKSLNIGMVAVDIAVFAFLFRLLRARFLDARHARVQRRGRRGV